MGPEKNFDPNGLVKELKISWGRASQIKKKNFLRAALQLVEGEVARARQGGAQSFDRLWIRMMLELRTGEDEHRWFCILAKNLQSFREKLGSTGARPTLWIELYYAKLKKLYGEIQ